MVSDPLIHYKVIGMQVAEGIHCAILPICTTGDITCNHILSLSIVFWLLPQSGHLSFIKTIFKKSSLALTLKGLPNKRFLQKSHCKKIIFI